MSDRQKEDAFLRNVAAHYTAPPMTESQRTRFDARLEERMQRGIARSRPWLAAVAAAAVASLYLWQSNGVAPTGREEVARVAATETAPENAASLEDWLSVMDGDSLADANAGLPADYVAISDLLLGN